MAPQPKTGEPMIEEQRLRRFDGTYRWFRDTGVASRDERGELSAGMAIPRTSTTGESGSRAAPEREGTRLLVDTVPTMIWLMTPAGLPYYFNKRFVDWAGIDSGQGGTARHAAIRLACGVVPSR